MTSGKLLLCAAFDLVMAFQTFTKVSSNLINKSINRDDKERKRCNMSIVHGD